jgi:precorrin-2 dehydrogenase/sirohydrochlorin ferrochelatase
MMLDVDSFPIMLNLSGRLAVVVGGGAVGLRKVQSLLDAGAKVALVEPALTGDDEQALQPGSQAAGPSELKIIRQPYCRQQLAGAFLVFACTNQRELNSQIAADARRIGAMVNAADQAEDCDFFMPAVVREGMVVLAIGTGGAVPGLSGFLRDHLAGALPPRVGQFAEALSAIRPALPGKISDSQLRMAIAKQLAGRAGYERFIAGGSAGLGLMLAELIAAWPLGPKLSTDNSRGELRNPNDQSDNESKRRL